MIALEHLRQTNWGYDRTTQPKLQGSSKLLQLRSRSLSAHRRLGLR
jgi:hypothetical protein